MTVYYIRRDTHLIRHTRMLIDDRQTHAWSHHVDEGHKQDKIWANLILLFASQEGRGLQTRVSSVLELQLSLQARDV